MKFTYSYYHTTSILPLGFLKIVIFIKNILSYLVPVLDVAGGLNAISDSCNCVLFKLSLVVLTVSAVSARSFKDFFCRIGSTILRQPIHLQFPEHGIFA